MLCIHAKRPRHLVLGLFHGPQAGHLGIRLDAAEAVEGEVPHGAVVDLLRTYYEPQNMAPPARTHGFRGFSGPKSRESQWLQSI